MIRLRPFVFLFLTLATAGHALGQVSGRPKPSSSDPRTDLNQLSGSGSSHHNVRVSGSYYLSANIKCSAGMSAITIDPAASSVVIDFNGFGIEGAPGGTSGNGIDCPAALIPRSILKVYRFSASGLGGDGMSIDSVDSVEVNGATVSHCGGDGISLKHVRRDGAILSADFGYSHRGLRGRDVLLLHVVDVSVSNCDVGIEACAEALQLEGAAIQGCASDGILLDDSCSPAGVVSPPRKGQLYQVSISDSGGDGIELRSSGASSMELSAADLSVTNCGQNGLYVPVVPAGAPSVGPPSVSLRAATFMGCGGSGVSSEGLASSSGTINHHYAHVDCSRNALSGISMAGGSTLEGESLNVGFNGGSGIEVRSPPTRAGALRLSGVQCSGNGLDGLYLEGSTPIIRGTALLADFHFVGNGRHGWSATNFDATATHGMIDGNTNDGIHAVDSDLEVSGTGIAHSGNDGVNLQGGKYRGWDGMIYGTHRCGVQANGSKIQIRGVDVAGNTEDGVRLTSSTYEQSGGSLSDCGFNGISAIFSPIVMDKVFVGGNTQGGVRLVSSSAQCSGMQVVGNGGDGVFASAPPAGPSLTVDFRDGSLSGNGGYGMRTTGVTVPKLSSDTMKDNVAGGFSSSSGGGCAPVLVYVSDCTFDGNGGTAVDLQNARGGLVERITILGSATGIHVGDPAGLGCSGGVRVSDCTVVQCTTGYSIDPGGGNLVLRNFASQCSGAAFAVGVGNLFGPVVANQGDMLATTNPNANFAQ